MDVGGDDSSDIPEALEDGESIFSIVERSDVETLEARLKVHGHEANEQNEVWAMTESA